MRNSLSDIHPFSKIIFSLFIILATFLLTFLIGFLFAIPLFHINIADLPNVLTNYTEPENIKFLKYLQTLQAIGLFILPAFIVAYIFHSKSIKYLKFEHISIRPSVFTIIILFASIPIINSLAVLNEGMQFPDWLRGIENWMTNKESDAKKLTEAFLKMDTLGSLYFNIIMIGILPSIGEELIFRGIFQRLFAEWTKNIHWGIIIAAFLFSAMHMQFYGFLPRFLLGVLLGYLFYWSGSIWIPILGHFVNNTTAVILYYFYADKMNENIENFGANQDSSIYLLLGIIVVVPLLYLFYKENKKITTS
ncbi:MAG: CPBP family intramembrane metalloprotease [Bacteroidales bacterium]|jgi:membrane protease YdiL (CAAX protease family)|nr:CPBP family intramembrane metalloprotease [Bacteroidales bacterium]